MYDIETIKSKLNELKALDQRFSIFGTSRHKYEWNATLSAEEIQEIEKANDIILSEEYKAILMYLGNGGAGSSYGLEKLSLKHISPPYPGTEFLLRNWTDTGKLEIEMVDSDEISGYIKLFDHGCGMQTCLVVNGQEKGDLIFFDSDECFYKLAHNSLLKMYTTWLDTSLQELKRVQQKLQELPLQEVIDSEWTLENYAIHDMILSLINGDAISGGHSGAEKKVHLEKEYRKWKNQKG